MSDFKIIQSWLYHQRVIYLVQIKDKYCLFYKSTGRAGHDSKGEILPHSFLKETTEYESWIGDGTGGMPQGWISKVYNIRGIFVSYHSKNREWFPDEMQTYFERIKKSIVTPIEENDPSVINGFVRKYIKTKDDWYDWGE